MNQSVASRATQLFLWRHEELRETTVLVRLLVAGIIPFQAAESTKRFTNDHLPGEGHINMSHWVQMPQPDLADHQLRFVLLPGAQRPSFVCCLARTARRLFLQDGFAGATDTI
jgi:hypothetical protein